MMASTKTLKMTFMTEGGKEYSCSIDEPKEDLKGEDVAKLMEDMIAKDFFATKNGKVVSAVGASIVEKTTTDLM